VLLFLPDDCRLIRRIERVLCDWAEARLAEHFCKFREGVRVAGRRGAQHGEGECGDGWGSDAIGIRNELHDRNADRIPVASMSQSAVPLRLVGKFAVNLVHTV